MVDVNSRKRIVAIGECMVEMAVRADGAYERNFAGDSFNTAWYLRQLLPETVPVDYCSALGDDAISKALLAFMEKSGLGTQHMRLVKERTLGLYMIELDHGERSFSYWRGQSAAKLLAEDKAFLERAVLGAKLVIFSGITLAILSPEHRQNLFAALLRARQAGSVIAFDPNMRRRLWPDEASMCQAIFEAAHYADMVFPSFDEDGLYFGDKSPEATIARYQNAGASTIIVKNGAGMIFGFDRKEGDCQFSPKAIAKIIDTTAAGDSFNAGFMSARFAGANFVQAIEKASLVAASVIQARGALVGLDQALRS